MPFTSRNLSGSFGDSKAKTELSLVESGVMKYLRDAEIKEANKYYKLSDRLNYILTRGIVNAVYKENFDGKLDCVYWRRDKNNKPYIQDSLVQFNLSHTEGFVLVAFSMDAIGVNIEVIEKTFNFEEIFDLVFSKKEILGIGKEVEKFFKYWVTKEAYLKFLGVGIIGIQEIETCNNHWTICL